MFQVIVAAGVSLTACGSSDKGSAADAAVDGAQTKADAAASGAGNMDASVIDANGKDAAAALDTGLPTDARDELPLIR